jgi:uncharacterized membrane protein YkvA (DUF1232 family)
MSRNPAGCPVAGISWTFGRPAPPVNPPYDPFMDLTGVVGVVVALAALWAVALMIFWLLRPKGVPAREILGLVPDVLRLLRSIILDSNSPLDVRLVLVGLVAWIVSPIDLIPEFIPVLGPLDDVVVAVVAMRYVRRRVGVRALRLRWSGTEEGFALLLRVIGSG